MKIIDLLNKIANGEEVPEYINYTHKLFGKDTMMVCKENIINELDKGAIELNDEIEIIEEDKKIEKLYLQYKDITKGINFEEQLLSYCDNLQYKINEIIDHINKENK